MSTASVRAGDVLAVGLDVGTTNTKAVLVEVGPDVRVLAGAAEPTPDSADALVAAVVRLVGQVLAGAPRAPDAVGIASMAETGVPLDDAGAPLRPFLRWDGRRGGDQAASLSHVLGRDALFAATGVRPSPKAPLATWAWLRAQEPQTWSRMHRWAGAADVVCLAMTGRLATDHTLAGRTMAYRLPETGGPLPAGFDADLLGAVGLRPEQLPDVVGPGQCAGGIRASAFIGAGLAAGTPVVVAGHDHAVGAYAAGAAEPGDVADSLGTAEAVVTVLGRRPQPAAVAAAGMSLVRTVSGRHDALVAGSAAGAMITWWLARMAGGRPAAEVFADLGQVPAGPTGVLVLPYPAGRQAPAPDPSATVEVLGRTDRHSPADLTRTLLEGLSLQARWMLAEQAQLTGAGPAGEVVVLGGAVATNPAWMGVKAAVTPAALRLVGVGEPVAAGAAVVAAERAGLSPPGAARLPAGPGGAEPAPGVRPGAAYDGVFERFVRAALAGGTSAQGAP